jgi:hypothetical protein
MVGGVGTELRKLLRWFGHLCLGCQDGQADEDCSVCRKRAAAMDANGIEWCKANREEIIGWLIEAADDRTSGVSSVVGVRGLTRALASHYLDRAIRRAEKLSSLENRPQ